MRRLVASLSEECDASGYECVPYESERKDGDITLIIPPTDHILAEKSKAMKQSDKRSNITPTDRAKVCKQTRDPGNSSPVSDIFSLVWEDYRIEKDTNYHYTTNPQPGSITGWSL